MTAAPKLCAERGCEKPANKAGLCWAHRKQRQRSARDGAGRHDLFHPRERPPEALAFLEAVLAIADAETHAEADPRFHSLWSNLEQAARAHLAARDAGDKRGDNTCPNGAGSDVEGSLSGCEDVG